MIPNDFYHNQTRQFNVSQCYQAILQWKIEMASDLILLRAFIKGRYSFDFFTDQHQLIDDFDCLCDVE